MIILFVFIVLGFLLFLNEVSNKYLEIKRIRKYLEKE